MKLFWFVRKRFIRHCDCCEKKPSSIPGGGVLYARSVEEKCFGFKGESNEQ